MKIVRPHILSIVVALGLLNGAGALADEIWGIRKSVAPVSLIPSQDFICRIFTTEDMAVNDTWKTNASCESTQVMMYYLYPHYRPSPLPAVDSCLKTFKQAANQLSTDPEILAEQRRLGFTANTLEALLYVSESVDDFIALNIRLGFEDIRIAKDYYGQAVPITDQRPYVYGWRDVAPHELIWNNPTSFLRAGTPGQYINPGPSVPPPGYYQPSLPPFQVRVTGIRVSKSSHPDCGIDLKASILKYTKNLMPFQN